MEGRGETPAALQWKDDHKEEEGLFSIRSTDRIDVALASSVGFSRLLSVPLGDRIFCTGLRSPRAP